VNYLKALFLAFTPWGHPASSVEKCLSICLVLTLLWVSIDKVRHAPNKTLQVPSASLKAEKSSSAPRFQKL
jgi:hypothetical protein